MRSLTEYLTHLPPREGGLRRGERLVVGLSGGADSVALTGLLAELAGTLELKIFAAHLDHGLRDESRAERDFCREFSRELGIPFAAARADVGERALATGEGIEAAGRFLRHRWLECVRQHYRADRIALAHHLDDHLETLLMWLGRGTGLSGLTGIPPVRDRIVRPLRQVRREELRAECRRRQWDWREDPANADPDRARNRLRSRVLPALETALGSDALERMGRMSLRAASERRALEALGADFVRRSRIRGGPGWIEVDRTAWAGSSQDIVFQGFRQALALTTNPGAHQRWNEARYRDVVGFIRKGKPGRRICLPGGGSLEITRNSLLLRGDSRAGMPDPGAPDADGLKLVERVLTAPVRGASFLEKDRACFDADQIHPPLNLRTVRPGDRMQPFGMEGHKKLVRLLAENSVPPRDRDRTLVVEDSRRILWAIGLTTSEYTRITPATSRVLELKICPNGKGPRP